MIFININICISQMLNLLLARHTAPVRFMLIRTINQVGKKMKPMEKELGVGKEIKKELCFGFGHSWEVPGGTSGPSSHCQGWNEATGVTGLVPGHRVSGGRAWPLQARCSLFWKPRNGRTYRPE